MAGRLSASPSNAVLPAPERVWAVRRAQGKPLEFLQSLAAYGDVVPFTIGRHNALLLRDPKHIDQVLRADDTFFGKGPAFSRARRLLGSGLLTADRDVHRQRRPVVQRAFHRAHMERYGALIVERAIAMSAAWSAAAPFDIAAEMQRLTLAVASKALFGEDLDESQAPELHQAIRSIASEDPLISLLAPARRRRRAEVFLRSFVARLVERRRQSGDSPDDLLSILMSQAPEDHPAAVAQLYDDVLTMMLAGHDTIANALTWTWILLAQQPEVEERLHAELADVLAGAAPDAAVVERLKFTRAVLAESLRLFPPAALLTRIAFEDFELDTATIPAGWLVVMSQYLVHRDARFFRDPLSFNPDRWLPPAEQLPITKLAYFPFGAGPRGCVGEGFAWLEGILVLAVIAARRRISPVMPDAVEAETRVTLRPRSPVWARVESRRP